jgi:cyclase
LVKNKGLVKTRNFGNPKYVGDPLNAVRIFNEKEVDELVVLDIDASADGRDPDYTLIKNLASECRMPLCYGGGIKNVEQAKKILGLGVEKVALGSIAVESESIVSTLSSQVGSQSVVVVLDAKKKRFSTKYELFVNNAMVNTKLCPLKFAVRLEELGAGELVINSVDNDGLMRGYDLGLINEIRQQTSIPITAVGGAGTLSHISELFVQEGLIGAGAGSLFVFKGKYRAVLISYPSPAEKVALFSEIPEERFCGAC